jgi:hypothetical protein
MDNLLEQLLDPEHRAHAYVLAGSQARDLSSQFIQVLFCRDACGQCTHCQKLESGNHPDLRWVQAEGKNIKIDQIRALQQNALYPPSEAPCKVFVLEGAHHLSREAANSLLKILESPPSYLIFLLITQQMGRMLPTVLSRCRIVQGGEKVLDQDISHLCWNDPQWLDHFELDQTEPEPLEPTPDILAKALNQKDLPTLHTATQMLFEALGIWQINHVLRFAALFNKAEKPQQSYVLQGLVTLLHQSMSEPDPSVLSALRQVSLSYGALQANANVQLLLESCLLRLREARQARRTSIR